MSELSALIAQRGARRGVVTKKTSEFKSKLPNITLTAELDGAVALLQSYQSKLQGFDEQIQALIKDEKTLETDIEESDNYFVLVSCTISLLKERISYLGNMDVPKVNIKPPKLDLPKFSGDWAEWTHFWDSFRQIHDGRQYNDIDRIRYLSGQLTGEAKQLVSGISLEGSNYKTMVDLLTTTYGKPTILKASHIMAIAGAEGPSEDLQSLVSYRAFIEGHIRSLQILQVTTGEILTCLCHDKLPSSLDTIIKRANGDKWMDLELFREKLRDEINTIQTKGLSHRHSFVDETVHMTPKATAAFTVGKETTFHCKLCGKGNHSWTTCPIYDTNYKKVEKAKVLKLCLNCLSSNHFRNNCDLSRIRPCFNCGGKHYTKLCLNTRKKAGTVNINVNDKHVMSNSSTRQNVPSKVVPVQIKNVGVHGIRRKLGIQSRIDIPLFKIKGKIKCSAFLDTGSQLSFIRRSLLNKVKYEPIYDDNLALKVFHHNEKVTRYECVKVFYGYKGKTFSMPFFVEDDDYMPEGVEHEGLGKTVKKLRDSGIVLSDSYGKKDVIDLFIGSDNYYTLVHPGFVRRGGLVIIPTKFGYTLGGAYTQPLQESQINPVVVMKVAMDSLNDDFQLEQYIDCPSLRTDHIKEDLTALWDLDHIGITDDVVDKQSLVVLKEFEENLTFKEEYGQYEVCLPWKVDPINLKSNFGLAKGRLRGIQNKFIQNRDFANNYAEVIQEQENRGFIERVPDHEIENSRFPVHYLAHHGVVKDSLTSKLRIVFDCSARTSKNSLSLNDCLFAGPSLVPDMVQVLLRFRLFEFACISDIEKAYLMLRLNIKDKDVTRFLWPENIHDPNSKLVVFRFTVVLFGATCSQFLLNATILRHLSLARNKSLFKRGLYIDNLQYTSNNENDLISFYWEAQQTFSAAHLNLREWNSNSLKLNLQVEVDNVITKRVEHSKVLGLKWFPETDLFHFKEIKFDDIHTKRGVLSDMAKIFDPLGYILPITVRGRLLIQDLWRSNLKWDTVLPCKFINVWKDLQRDVKLSLSLPIPRVLTTVCDVELHVFCDASKIAYGAVCYFTFSGENSNSTNDNQSRGVSKFVIAKAKIAPIKPLTIPKLELTSVVLAARLVRYVVDAYEQELRFKGINIWIDSQIVLCWLKYKKSDVLYVRNRVDDIHSTVPNAIFRYVPTKDNPSDLLTRGVNFETLNSSLLWREGPTWLVDKESWPCWSDCDTDRCDSAISEERGSFDLDSASESCTNIVKASFIVNAGIVGKGSLIEYDRYSSYDKIIRIAAYVLRFVNNLLNKIRGINGVDNSYLEIKELRYAECIVIQDIQTAEFALEFECLAKINEVKKGTKAEKRLLSKTASSLVGQLGLFIESKAKNLSILRCRSRLEYADLPREVKHPILLPHKHHVTRLLVDKAHRVCAHYGLSYVVAYLRQRYWIPRIRQTVKGVIAKCITCKRFQGRAFDLGVGLPSLPEIRVREAAPFEITGVDYTGALYVREGNPGNNENTVKVYIILFTCAVTRAVHVELVKDQTTDTFLRAFRRFCSRKTYPSLMLSDNAPYFVSAAGFLGDINEDPKINELRDKVKCKWHFIPVRAPWFGAIWERCIGILKSGLKKVLGRALVSFDELHTILVELEAIVNDRPLTYVSGELGEPEPLTPSHLLTGRRSKLFPDCAELVDWDDPDFVRNQSSSQELIKRNAYLSKIVRDFWKRWSGEYLTFLRQFQTSGKQVNENKWPVVGDVVLIPDDGPRMFWKVGRIIQLFGDKNNYRVAKLKSKWGVSVRPLTKLYPLEVRAEEERENSTADPSPGDDTAPFKNGRLIPRRTARMAADLWRSKIACGDL